MSLWKDVKGVELGDFPIMTFAEAERRYGSDKPDLRNPMELVDVADLVKDVEFEVFSGPANDAKGRVAALRVPGGAAAEPQADRRLRQLRQDLRRERSGLY